MRLLTEASNNSGDYITGEKRSADGKRKQNCLRHKSKCLFFSTMCSLYQPIKYIKQYMTNFSTKEGGMERNKTEKAAILLVST